MDDNAIVDLNSINLTLYSLLNNVSEQYYSIDFLRANDLDINTEQGHYKVDVLEDLYQVNNILCFKEDLLDYFTQEQIDSESSVFYDELKGLMQNRAFPCYAHSSNLKVKASKLKSLETPFKLVKFNKKECYNKNTVKINQSKSPRFKQESSLKDIEYLLPLEQAFKPLIYYFYCLQADLLINVEDVKKIEPSDVNLSNIKESILISSALVNSKSLTQKF